MSDPPRSIEHRFPGIPTLEGAGVRLRRSFSNNEVPLFDPFLLLDRFGSTNPEDYLAGFPWHPHRGIETVTYVLDGRVAHGDTLGNSGVIGSGDVQWMNSGSGIIHQEMPQLSDGGMSGFQLWVNLPAREKMSVPAYRGLSAGDIPEVSTDSGNRVKVVAGNFGRVEGPVRGIPVDPDVPRRPRSARRGVRDSDEARVHRLRPLDRWLGNVRWERCATGRPWRDGPLRFGRCRPRSRLGFGPSVPPRLGTSVARARRLVRSDRHEHARRAARRLARASERRVHQAQAPDPRRVSPHSRPARLSAGAARHGDRPAADRASRASWSNAERSTATDRTSSASASDSRAV